VFLGLGFLRAVSPDFGDLANQEQELEGTFRLVILHRALAKFITFISSEKIQFVGPVTFIKVHALKIADAC
jgi:hypothetical protein